MILEENETAISLKEVNRKLKEFRTDERGRAAYGAGGNPVASIIL